MSPRISNLRFQISYLASAALAFVALIAGPAFAADKPSGGGRLPKITIVLVGDSTVNDDQGWGPGFKKLLKPEARCINRAKNGASSKSFLDGGYWKKALADKPDYVLIQFGHNDMPGKGPQRETDPATTYPEFLKRYIDQSRAAGAAPILVTSLARRHFGADSKIQSDLATYAAAARKLTAEQHVPLIDLNALSIELLNQLGPKASADFDPPSHPKPGQKPIPDRTHLTPKGAEAFGKIVAEELKKVEPALAPYVQ